MRIAATSDLHLDHPPNRRVFEIMLERLRATPVDLLLVAGDLASSRDEVADALDILGTLPPRVAFVPGNHDLWSPWRQVASGQVNTWDIYREALLERSTRAGVHYLPAHPLVLGNLAVVGVTGWYDYSLATRVARFFFDDKAFRRGYHGAYAWSDPLRTEFRTDTGEVMSDAQVTETMARDLEAQLRDLPAHVATVVAVTHVVPFKELVPSRPFFARDFFTAFLGSRRYGAILSGDPRVRVAVCGHTHTPSRKRIGGIQAVCSPLGYPREWRGNPRRVAADRLATFEIPSDGSARTR